MKRSLPILIALAVLLLGTGIWYTGRPKTSYANLDQFAQCLASKQVTMYGAAWCSHCQNEKAAFGSSFRHVPYVECPQDPKACVEKGIEGYPTWIFADGRKLVGEQGLAKLSLASGCELPVK